MSKKTVGLVSAISALPLAAAGTPSEARTLDDVMVPRSYAELLQPIPNAIALLGEAKAREVARPEPRIQTAQYYGGWGGWGGGGYGRPYYHHHHHHHHHWNGGWGGWGGGGYYRPRYYHHHHHHHHHWNGGWW